MSPRIQSVKARQIWDSRGRPTVEVDIRLEGGGFGRAAAPAGASRGIHEAIDLRDGGSKFGGFGVTKAVSNVNNVIANAFVGKDADQEKLDTLLSELDGTQNFSRLGGNATVAVSLALSHALANASGKSLWQYLASGQKVRLPVPEIQIFGGGAHAGRRTDIQDFMVMVPGAESLRRAFEVIADVYRAAGRLMEDQNKLSGTADEGGWWPNFDSNEDGLSTLTKAIEKAGYRPGQDVFISLDIAASEFYRDRLYQLGLDGTKLESDAMIEVVTGWCARYPILSIEDPVAQDHIDAMAKITALVGKKVQVVGDDFLVTDASRVARAVEAGACNCALIKVNQAGTVSRALSALREAKKAGWATIVSARSGETEDVSISHLSTGWDSGQFKVGSFARSERMAKWNELLRFEEEMGDAAQYAGWSGLPQLARA
ncbi:MAG TPA: phosphopyruvate hydratase [Rhizomicrobium sp.]|nr:phosphopyruvate hydratase [Rhizomicrobium sp.]